MSIDLSAVISRLAGGSSGRGFWRLWQGKAVAGTLVGDSQKFTAGICRFHDAKAGPKLALSQ